MISSIGNSGNTMATQPGKQLSTTGATNGSTSFQDIFSNLNNNDKVAISTAETNKNDFVNWKKTYFTKGISEDCHIRVEENSVSFEQIIDKAVANGGYNDPQTFVNNLSSSELAVLQHIHGLADPIIPQGLSKEGALNLLYSPDQSKDINNDGLTMTGLAPMWQYPPPNAPEAVKKAWEEATAGLSDMEAALKMGPFMPTVFPDQAGWKNIYAEPGFSYTQQVTDILKTMEINKPSDYEEQRDFLLTFVESLKKNQAA